MTNVDNHSFSNGGVKSQNLNAATAVMKKSQRRRRRKQKKNKASDALAKENSDPQQALEQVVVEYIPETAELDGNLDDEFWKVIERFALKVVTGNEETKMEENVIDAAKTKVDSDSDDEEQEKDIMSNKQKKLQRRMKIAELKQICTKPDVVEVWDANSSDPKLLVYLKSYRNTVPVPRHWCQKRKYLQGKRGIEKQPFKLPDSIAATGIENFREAYTEKQDNKRLKQKQREKMHPKMEKLDMEWEVLHDAFFKYRTKPKLTSYGDLYHEGKEFERDLRKMKVGMVSRDLKEALGMPDGCPPPWLINMQRYGPPPSYPDLKIPGLNAPIPSGARFGYHPGGWGKPPVDESGQPLYGDVFGHEEEPPNYDDEPEDKTKLWGEFEDELEEEEEEEDDEEEEIEISDKENEVEDGIKSVPNGDTTPDIIELRKQQRKEETEKPLYEVVEEKEEKIGPGILLGTTHTYVIGGAKRVDPFRGPDRVEVCLKPEELEAMDDVLPAKYEEAREEKKMGSQHEDFSDMVAENEKKRKRKMKDKDSKSKKKEFKF